MARVYYSQQYYNQLKKKYYEEYRRRQIEYYLYQRKYYEEYRRRQNEFYLYKKKYYEEYRRRQIEYYLHQRKCYEEYLKRQNGCYSYEKKHNEEPNKRNSDIFANKRKYNKANTSQSEFSNSFKTDSVEDNNINDNSCSPFEINIEENTLKYKKHDSTKYDNLENKDCNSTQDSYNEEFLGKKEEEDKSQVDKCNSESCKTEVSPETLPHWKTISHTADVTAKFVTVKIPVVLTECSITITVESSLKLEDAVLEIKQVRKNIYLNQCKLIPNSENDKPNTGILFLAGFIRSNIEYFTKESNDKEVLSGKLKHATVNVPFECTTRVTFKTPPKIKATTSKDEVEILQTSIGMCNPYEEEITGRDIREQSFRSIEYFNEKVFCELISAEFVESYILEKPTNKECKSPIEQTFHDVNEKVVLSLTIKLLQNQNVKISK